MKARKRFGQHFLEAAWADRLVNALRLTETDTVIEIGPGRGALTFRLAPRVRRVVAIEIDRDLCADLAPHLPPHVTLVQGDILRAPLDSLVPPDVDISSVRVVGNLPYNISSPILFRLFDWHRERGAFRDATVMLQREVADRLAAGPGSKAYGVLSITAQMDAHCESILALPPGAFRPAPAVSSAVVRLTFRPPVAPVVDRQVFETMVRGLFMARRKTVSNALKPVAAARGLDSADVLQQAKIDAMRRPETLTAHELAALADLLAGTTPAD